MILYEMFVRPLIEEEPLESSLHFSYFVFERLDSHEHVCDVLYEVQSCKNKILNCFFVHML